MLVLSKAKLGSEQCFFLYIFIIEQCLKEFCLVLVVRINYLLFAKKRDGGCRCRFSEVLERFSTSPWALSIVFENFYKCVVKSLSCAFLLIFSSLNMCSTT